MAQELGNCLSPDMENASEPALVGEAELDDHRLIRAGLVLGLAERHRQMLEAERRIVRRRDDQLSGHPQMNEQGGTIVERDGQIFAAPGEPADHTTEEPSSTVEAARAHDIGKCVAANGNDRAADDAWFKRAPNGLDLGKFWHGGSMIERRGSRREAGDGQAMTANDAPQATETSPRFDPNCVFCRIARGDFDTSFLAESAHAVAFADLAPQAPVHVLIIPRDHIADLSVTTAGDEPLLGELLGLARQVARDQGVDEGGYRVLTNTGPDAGQSVFHLHLHLLGGRPLDVGLG